MLVRVRIYHTSIVHNVRNAWGVQMVEISRRNLLGLALAGLAGCRCSIRKSNPLFKVVKLSHSNPVWVNEHGDRFTLLNSQDVIFEKNIYGEYYANFIPLIIDKIHDYDGFIRMVEKSDRSMSHNSSYYEILNLDTGKSNIFYA